MFITRSEAAFAVEFLVRLLWEIVAASLRALFAPLTAVQRIGEIPEL